MATTGGMVHSINGFEDANKENATAKISVISAIKETESRVSSPVRNPLHIINATSHSREGVLQRRSYCYSPITPAAVEESGQRRKKGRKSCFDRIIYPTSSAAVNNSQKLQPVVPKEVMINSLVYVIAKQTVQEEMQKIKEEYEMRLSEKNDQLMRLQTAVRSVHGFNLSSSSSVVMTTSDDDTHATAIGPVSPQVAMVALESAACQTSILESPPQVTGDKSTMTSPLCQFLRRLSQVGADDNEELLRQLEMATISADVWRTEVKSVEQVKAGMEEDLIELKSRVEEAEDRIQHAVSGIRMEMQREIDESAEKEAELQQQIDQLQQQLSSSETTLLERTNQITALQQQAKQLQQDLSIMFKQRKQAEENCNKYKELYEQMFRSEHCLQAQLDELLAVKPCLEKIRAAQLKMSQATKEAYNAVIEMDESVKKNQEEFNIEMDEWRLWKDGEEKRLIELSNQCAVVMEEREHRAELMLRLRELEEELECMTERADGLSISLSVEHEQHLTTSKKLTESSELREKLERDLNELKDLLHSNEEEHELVVVNLQRTLDVREHDYEELRSENDKLREQSVMHRVELERLRKDARRCMNQASRIVECENNFQILEKRYNELIEATRKDKQTISQQQKELGDSKITEHSLNTLLAESRSHEQELHAALEELRQSQEQLIKDRSAEALSASLSLNGLHQAVQAVVDMISSHTLRINELESQLFGNSEDMRLCYPNVPSFTARLATTAPHNSVNLNIRSKSCGKISCEPLDAVPAGTSCPTLCSLGTLSGPVASAASEEELDLRSEGSSNSERLADDIDIMRVYIEQAGRLISINMDKALHIINQQVADMGDEKYAHDAEIRKLNAELSDYESSDSMLRRQLEASGEQLQKKVEALAELRRMVDEMHQARNDAVDQAAVITRLTKDLNEEKMKSTLKNREIESLRETFNDTLRYLTISCETGGSAGFQIHKDLIQRLIADNQKENSASAEHLHRLTAERLEWIDTERKLNDRARALAELLVQEKDKTSELYRKMEMIRSGLMNHTEVLKMDPNMLDIMRSLGVCVQNDLTLDTSA